MKKIIEYLMIFLLSGTFLFFGKVFVYMLGDEHAFGDSAPFNFSYFLYCGALYHLSGCQKVGVK
ncbi:hypothetical protein POF51_31645 [Brevibacillus sp. AG]|uniref:hypothetical protein n=1 Tax=Brevibacillus sp. AG TaxID=3020891 RepID=UPI001FCD5B6D|nr:hypothetical protein [Brevibacillus sp. AG]MDC0765272.1 hypothetical protein [Brevibacillus sp. AG]